MIGIYGVTAYVVTSRTREIAVRVALGAQRGDIVRMILRQGMKLTGMGIAIGCLLAAGGSRLMGSLLFGGATDPAAFVIPAMIFALTALAACYLPARRASGIEPAVALRNE
jgi:ABC-type antimicrobial peptide transport system permease subunit